MWVLFHSYPLILLASVLLLSVDGLFGYLSHHESTNLELNAPRNAAASKTSS